MHIIICSAHHTDCEHYRIYVLATIPVGVAYRSVGAVWSTDNETKYVPRLVNEEYSFSTQLLSLSVSIRIAAKQSKEVAWRGRPTNC